MMKIIKFTFLFAIATVMLFSCKSDDNVVGFGELRDRGEQQVTDDADLVEFLTTHFYNYDEFDFTDVTSTANDTFEMTFGKIEGVNAGRTPLINQVETRTFTYFDVDYKYYVLKLREGGGEGYTRADRVEMTYRGQLLNLDTFDYRVTTENIELTGISGGAVKGFELGLPEFKTAVSIENGANGFRVARNGGIGAIFIPSGLGYFSLLQGTIPAYSPLIFSFNVFDADLRDHDSDSVLSSMEDIDNDGEVRNDDTDGDGTPNFADADDDGDGTLTINEIEQKSYTINVGDPDPAIGANEIETTRTQSGNEITIRTIILTDTDGDGTPDYLDNN